MEVLTFCPVVLAAGLSRRMEGENLKMNLPYRGSTILGTTIERVQSFTHLKPILIINDGVKIPGDLQKLIKTTVLNPDPSRGQGSSLSLAANEAEKIGADGIFIFLGDMPEITKKTVDKVVKAAAKFPDEIVLPVDDEGKPQHPVYFGRPFFKKLKELTGDTGGREIIKKNDQLVHKVLVPTCEDIDTMEMYKKALERSNEKKA